LEQELRVAVTEGTIRPFYQPVVDLKTGNVVGFEMIPRWEHPRLGEVSHERFIPIAEDNGSIHDLSERLLGEACAAATKWPADIVLAFDIYPTQLRDRGLKSRIISVLERTGLAPNRLELEITESALVQDLDSAQETLGFLHALGVRIALGNFGTGYSNLYHLRNFRLDKIKIDRSLVESLASENESAKIISALVGLGHGLGLTVSAEGIKSLEEGASLLSTGCEQGQGVMFGKALTVEATVAFFAEDLYCSPDPAA
jgi:EAL domain-containing protein (putative c-di-GMP-specific phosphodiesterase class I)